MGENGSEAVNDNLISSEKINNSMLANTNFSYWDFYHDEEFSVSDINVITIILCCFGIIANILSIVLVTKMHKNLTPHLKLIISLCVSDAIIVVANLSREIVLMMFSKNICFTLTVRLMINYALFATLVNLLAIAVDHYLAIMKPLTYRNGKTSYRANCCIFGIWILSTIVILIEIVHGVSDRNTDESLCEAIAWDGYENEVGIVIFIFLVLCVICMIYARIYIRIHSRRSKRSKLKHNQTDSSSLKALVTTSIFVGTFILFWAPTGIFNLFLYFQTVKNNLNYIGQGISEILYRVLLLNTIADPAVYTFRLPQIQKKCLSTMKSRRSTRKSRSTSEIMI